MAVQYETSLPDDTDLKLVESIQKNAKRYIDVFSEAVDAIMPKETKEIS
jgi:DNA replication licensing factor MCM7